MGRLKKDDPREHIVNFRLNGAELTALQSRARSAGRTLSGYGREVLLGSPKEQRTARSSDDGGMIGREAAEATRELAEQIRRAGVNLNQIAKHMNETKSGAPRSLIAAIDEIRSYVDDARRLPEKVTRRVRSRKPRP